MLPEVTPLLLQKFKLEKYEPVPVTGAKRTILFSSLEAAHESKSTASQVPSGSLRARPSSNARSSITRVIRWRSACESLVLRRLASNGDEE